MHDTPLQQVRQTPALSARAVLGDSALPASREGPVRSLYIHVPFCFHKCHYCDFYSFVDTRDRQPAFADRLIHELAALAPFAAGAPLRTIFVGGGTPSLLAPHLWRTILDALDRLFDLSLIRSAGAHQPGQSEPRAEFTVECNPETVSPELMDILAAGGVSRVSIGAQSFHEQHLKTLERWHDPANVAKALGLARAAGITRQSIDLIYAIPGQTVGEWAADLRTAIDLGTEHVSCYNLTYEPNTAMTKRLARGEFEPAEEDAEIEMFTLAAHTLGAAGFERYEVSNYARPGCASRHNLAYWRQEQWLAAGPSASAHVAGHRYKNVPRLDDYLTVNDAGFAPITDLERPDQARAISERIMTGLRLAEGLDAVRTLADLEALDPTHAAAGRVRQAAAQACARGLLVDDAARWTLTQRGILLADGIAGELMRAIRD